MLTFLKRICLNIASLYIMITFVLPVLLLKELGIFLTIGSDKTLFTYCVLYIISLLQYIGLLWCTSTSRSIGNKSKTTSAWPFRFASRAQLSEVRFLASGRMINCLFFIYHLPSAHWLEILRSLSTGAQHQPQFVSLLCSSVLEVPQRNTQSFVVFSSKEGKDSGKSPRRSVNSLCRRVAFIAPAPNQAVLVEQQLARQWAPAHGPLLSVCMQAGVYERGFMSAFTFYSYQRLPMQVSLF